MAAHMLGSRPRTEDVSQGTGDTTDFKSLLLSRPVLDGLEAAGFNKPSPIQSKAIPLGRCGLDLIVQAKSGTGKTCVFSTVALDSLILENTATQVLVLAPTREIAVQIHSVMLSIGCRMEGLESHVFIGGTPLPQDKIRLKKCHIAVGSPGRIKQLIEIGYLNTSSVRLFILDEADKLLEEGSFQEQINWIYSSLPANKQMLAVSATYPESLAKALTRYMREPTFVRLNVTDPSLLGLKQFYKVVKSHPLPHKVFDEKVMHLQELFNRISFNQALVFSNLHSRAQHLANILTAKGFPAVCISGSMNQNQRLDAVAKLKQFHCRVLISTDLTSRGIDAERVNLVINLDVPEDWETYMHRIGRAGRFGTHGLSVTFCCHGEEENMMMGIAMKCNLKLLPLPDPIPDGLMEETCNWDIEVTTVKTIPSSSENQGVCTTEVLSSNPLPETYQNKKATKTHSKTKKTSMKLYPEKESKKGETTVNCDGILKPPKDVAKPKKPVDNTVNNSANMAELQNSLPKIPSLASFKRSVACTSSFAELVEDYEQFIKEGLEKHVEIVRVYTGPGDKNELKSENLEQERTDDGGTSEAMSTPEKCGFAESSVSESDRSASCSSSVSEESNEDSDIPEPKSSFDHLNSYSEVIKERTIEPTVCELNTDNISDLTKEGNVMKAHKYKGEMPFVSNTKSRRRSKYTTPVSRRELCSERQDDLYQLEYRNPSRFPYGTTSYADYWRSYYQAWQTYHSTVSNSYYRNLYKRSSWMSAYHMQSVYLHEMLKP
ncbi:probable ATP-dependent RNA helicase DDX20 [Xenopus tropicalis]|nr:probable ATP-dependent RNA helicase DDX20 [Xenopus tropicalis]|eukprot:XP_002932842.1 PREDICTED: probable ATP-dependent RNA helicase DDX20 [Xenopus tropicalis]